MKQLSILFASLFSILNGFSQSADELIEKHLQALGGKDKLQSLESVVMEGVVSAQGMEIPVTTTIVNKKGMRVDISVMGMDGWTVMRPDSGWSFMPFGGQTQPEPIPAEVLKESKDRFDLTGELCDYSKKGNKVEYLGLDDVDGTECHKLKCTNPEGKVSYYLLDPQKYLLVKTIMKSNAMGKEMEMETKYSNYKEVEGGYVFPYSIESQNGPIDMKKISVNVKVPASKLMLKD